MIQCKECELCKITPEGAKTFLCDPFSNIKEPECIQKWQLIRLDMLLATYHRMLGGQQKMAPLQDKIFKYMEKEIGEIDESDKWKVDDDDDQPDEPTL